VQAHGEPPVFLTFPGLAAAGLPHATTTRHCPGVGTGPPFGEAAVGALSPAGVPLARVAWARQVHGPGVARVGPAGGFVGEADILVTTAPGVALVVFTADCLGLVLWDPEVPVLAVAHVGWRGLVRGAPAAALEALIGLGARPDRLRVAMGPAIGPCCYEIDGPVVDACARAYPGTSARWMRPGRPGHCYLDLGGAVADLLEARGIRRAHVEQARLCTACRPDLLMSYRRGHVGRLVTLAALP
jgi:hypothetical protein